ncbi:MAG: TonB family protein [Lewinellaceae bacterium]|nr:TonB family protein [Lewinellaceae bacterium]
MEKDKKKPLFIHQPEYPGGPKALSAFIQEHLRYPAAALEAGAEGTVIVEYDIDYQGKVVATRVLQGVGSGCDEEACRVVRLLKFDVPKNRGVRVLFHKKAHIKFKKPAPLKTQPTPSTSFQVNYTVSPAKDETPAEAAQQKPVYTYTIQL